MILAAALLMSGCTGVVETGPSSISDGPDSGNQDAGHPAATTGEACLVDHGCQDEARCTADGGTCVQVATSAGELLALYECPYPPPCDPTPGLVLTGTAN